MICTRRLIFGAAAAISAAMASSAVVAGDYSPRQYYSDWHPHSGGSYYRHYYYKPTPEYAGYKHHYSVYYPSHPKHAYYYNPYQKKFWGRCDLYSHGQPEYSHLPAEYQKPTLAEIPESAFPTPGPLPPIPESKDGAKLDLPPDVPPPNATAQAAPGTAAPAP